MKRFNDLLKAHDWKSIRTWLPPDILKQAQARAKHLGISTTSLYRAAFMYGVQRATPSDMLAYHRKWMEIHDQVYPPTPPRTMVSRHGQTMVCDHETGRMLRLIG